MKIFQLDFSQKIWLGFVIIITLLSLSSALSWYGLSDISDSTKQVNEAAVPVLKQSNQAQISLLKQAKLSSFGFNAETPVEITKVSEQFSQGAGIFDQHYRELEQTVSLDPSMSELVSKAGIEYQNYKKSVEEMFEAKSSLIQARTSANEELRNLSNLVDDAGAFLLDVVWSDYADDDEKRELMEGIQGRLDGLILGLYNVSDEINRSSDIEYLNAAKDSLREAVSGINVRNQHAENNLPDLRGRESWQSYLNALVEFEERATGNNSIVNFKVQQVNETKRARDKLNQSESEVRKVTAEFDQLLLAADSLFNDKQSGVLDAVALGTQSTIIAWIILILMASQNFNSMRKSIKKKMADLAKLNSTGEILSSLMDKNKSLEEVLAAMHEQVGVAQGSVYLMNKEDKLEVKAFYPPKAVEPESKPAQFSLGEGILGRAAEKKQTIFIRNTLKDPDFVKQGDSAASARALLCVPLLDKDVLIGAMNFSGDVKSVTFEDSDYEFASSIARMLVTTMKNIRMRETIEEQNRTLEQKVKERTAELRQKNKDIAVMMANMQQGLFTIMDGGVIHNEYSRHTETIFDTEQIANRNVMDLVFANSNLGADSLNQISTAVDSLLGEDEMMWDFNSHLLVTELQLHEQQDTSQILELDWDPIINPDNDEIEKIMVSVRDVTELRKLQFEAEQQKKELEIIGQILNVSFDKFSQFISSSYQFIQECRELVKKTPDKQTSVIETLFRNMHTIKGNARTYGFKQVNDIVHEVENTYDELRKDEDKQWLQDELLTALDDAEAAIKIYDSVAQQKLSGLSGDSVTGANVDLTKAQRLVEQALSIDFNSLDSKQKKWTSEAYQLLSSAQGERLDKVIASVLSSVADLADDLGRAQPKVEFSDKGYLFKNSSHELLNNVFMHILRNALDHGVEEPGERLQKGKNEQGTINIGVNELDSKLTILISDDGRGIAVEKIYSRAVESKLLSEEQAKPSPQEIANLVFKSGFSTADEVTEISGRGVGMDAVKQFLKEQGGDIELEVGEVLGEGYYQFITKVSLPVEFTVKQSLA
ncbi:MAG: ATP-binding protein [Kangiellaceae bacterium]|nr:ATP-binding protein [Kangiellaceae bacterium]